MGNKRKVDKETAALWKELEHYKKDNWCCTILREGSIEEHFKLEFSEVVPVKFGVNCCCQCGVPLQEGFEKKKDGKEDWCCRLVRNLIFEQIDFAGTGKETYAVQVNHCFHCGRKLKKLSGGEKPQNVEKSDKRD